MPPTDDTTTDDAAQAANPVPPVVNGDDVVSAPAAQPAGDDADASAEPAEGAEVKPAEDAQAA